MNKVATCCVYINERVPACEVKVKSSTGKKRRVCKSPQLDLINMAAIELPQAALPTLNRPASRKIGVPWCRHHN